MSDLDSNRPDESDIRSAWERGDFEAGSSATLRRYGGEVFGYLLSVHRDHDEASDAFSVFAERFWTTRERFRWQCSMRTWVYLLARNASADVGRGMARARAQPLDETSHAHIPELVHQVRTETLSIYRTEKRTAFEELCMTLSQEDRELLVLRSARGLAWREVALVLGSPDALSEGRDLEQECARIRKRFQLIRERLRELGRAKGLL